MRCSSFPVWTAWSVGLLERLVGWVSVGRGEEASIMSEDREAMKGTAKVSWGQGKSRRRGAPSSIWANLVLFGR
jgi:hypothetical protein